jgi:DNA-binding response OmpR family regulator
LTKYLSQMPIVDGLTSTKMIRAIETAGPVPHALSNIAKLNGRVPVIAVSASLVESKRMTYINAGFDGWILKPISFQRVNELIRGIADAEAREAALYRPGAWEKGGWFDIALPTDESTEMEHSVSAQTGQDEPSGAVSDISVDAYGVANAKKRSSGGTPLDKGKKRQSAPEL